MQIPGFPDGVRVAGGWKYFPSADVEILCGTLEDSTNNQILKSMNKLVYKIKGRNKLLLIESI